MKRCSKCAQSKDESEFYKRNNRKSGLYSCCKVCQKNLCKCVQSIEKQKLWREKNKERIKGYNKKYRVLQREWERKQRESNPKFRLDKSVGALMRFSLKEKKNRQRWEEFVGYSVEDLMKHLEKQFEDWMNWDNYGKWVIDHIKPRSLFNYRSPNEKSFQMCWALNNLQPLGKLENLKKSNHF